MRSATLSDVAKAAGVSKGTASKVLNGNEGDQKFGEECVARIRKAAHDLGYTPNYHAKSLNTRKANTLGFMLGREYEILQWHPYWAKVTSGIISGARERGYDFLQVGKRKGLDPVESAMAYLNEVRIDTLIVPWFMTEYYDMEIFNRVPGKIVLIMNELETKFPSASLNPEPGIRKAVTRIQELGHDNVLWVAKGGKPVPGISSQRFTQFKKCAEECGISVDVLAVSLVESDTIENSRDKERMQTAKTFSEYYKKNSSISAIFCCNEETAFGVYEAAWELGLSIPRDISVIGFDDIHAEYAAPSLSCISHMLDEIGRNAAFLAADLAEGKEPENGSVYVPSLYIERNSTGSPKG